MNPFSEESGIQLFGFVSAGAGSQQNNIENSNYNHVASSDSEEIEIEVPRQQYEVRLPTAGSQRQLMAQEEQEEDEELKDVGFVTRLLKKGKAPPPKYIFSLSVLSSGIRLILALLSLPLHVCVLLIFM